VQDAKDLAQQAAVMYVSIGRSIDPSLAEGVLQGMQGDIAVVIKLASSRCFDSCVERRYRVLKDIASLFERMSEKNLFSFARELISAKSMGGKIQAARRDLTQACAIFSVSSVTEPPPWPMLIHLQVSANIRIERAAECIKQICSGIESRVEKVMESQDRGDARTPTVELALTRAL
jgi:3-methyladenine DNA glycosylase/8-oxoguanine DNA glycosylase